MSNSLAQSQGSIDFHASKPPLLADIPIGTILQNKVVADKPKTSRCALAVDVWGRLDAVKASLTRLDVEEQPAFISIVDRSGRVIPNDGYAPVMMTAGPHYVLATVTETMEWHLVDGPEVISEETMIESTWSLETETTTLSTFQTELTAGIEASAKVNGLVTEASVTASLSTKIASAVTEQNTVKARTEKRATTKREPQTAYADWVLYTRYDFTVDDDMWGDSPPLNRAQFSLIKPADFHGYGCMMIYEDSCPQANLPQEPAQ